MIPTAIIGKSSDDDFQTWFNQGLGSLTIYKYKDDPQSFATMEMISTKLCLVTVGATASFERLIRQVLNEAFLAQLAKYHYTHLLVQYGKNGEKIWNEFNEKFPPGCEQLQGVTVGGFDFKPDLWRYMRMAVKEQNQDLGIIISHAGMTWNIFFLIYQINPCLRHWNHSGCASLSLTFDHCAQPRSCGQPSRGSGCGNGADEIRRSC